MKHFSFPAAPLLVLSALAFSLARADAAPVTDTKAKTKAAPHFSSAVNEPANSKKALARAPSTRNASKSASWLPATIVIAKLGVRAPVVRGVDNASLRYGVGFDPASDAIGARGNSVLAGHRNIWGSYFWYLPRLQRGDTILIEARQTQYFYRVEEARVVQPHETHVLDAAPDSKDARLTLYTCTKPKTECRFIVSAQLYQTLDISHTPHKSLAVAVPKKPVNKRTPPLPAIAKEIGKR